MRNLTPIATCLLCTAVLVVSGCAEHNQRIAALEEQNLQLVTDRDNLNVELASAREDLGKASTRAQTAETECMSLRDRIEGQIRELTNAKIREENLQDSLKQLQRELKETRDDYAVGVSRAQEATKKAKQAEQEAQKRIAELARELERTQAALEQARAEVRKARQPTEEPAENTD